MSNPRNWRGRGRTETPNSRQKRNKLYLDSHPTCHRCGQRPSAEAHHDLPHRHPARYEWRFMRALCIPCHTLIHKSLKAIVTPRQRSS
jgi:hypothetical protein